MQVSRVMRVDPLCKRPILISEPKDHRGVMDRRIDLQTVPDDSGIGEESCSIRIAVRCDERRIEVRVRSPKSLALPQDRQPRQTRLVDLEHESLEELRVATQREAVLVIVVRAVKRMLGSVAIAHPLILSKLIGT